MNNEINIKTKSIAVGRGNLKEKPGSWEQLTHIRPSVVFESLREPVSRLFRVLIDVARYWVQKKLITYSRRN